MEIQNKEQIFERREEIEKEILELLEETKSDFGLEDIKEIIYNEEDQDDLVHVMAMFDNGQGLSKMSAVLDAMNDAWNYFPHKCLDGFCPMEKVLEHKLKNL